MGTHNTLRADTEQNQPVLVSVIIPAYNAALCIVATLRSVFAQTFLEFEVILVNDGSPDTHALEQALAPFQDKIRYLKQENRGPSAARNTAIRVARGKYIAFLDSDDLWLPDHLARQVSLLDGPPELGLVYANALHLADDRAIGIAFDSVPQADEVTFEALLAEDCTVNTSSTVASREAVLAAGLFDESMNRCEDFDLWLRMSKAGVRMAYRRDVQICHRISHGLAANQELMKRGRAHVYEKMAACSDLTPSQRSIVERKQKELETGIQIEIARDALLTGRYQEALSATEQANRLLPNRKLSLAFLGLRYCPSLLRTGYRCYFNALTVLKRRRGVRRSQFDLPVGVDVAGLVKPGPSTPAMQLLDTSGSPQQGSVVRSDLRTGAVTPSSIPAGQKVAE
jgi:glycosyltransferase involved in cell wall biosynthesis